MIAVEVGLRVVLGKWGVAVALGGQGRNDGFWDECACGVGRGRDCGARLWRGGQFGGGRDGERGDRGQGADAASLAGCLAYGVEGVYLPGVGLRCGLAAEQGGARSRRLMGCEGAGLLGLWGEALGLAAAVCWFLTQYGFWDASPTNGAEAFFESKLGPTVLAEHGLIPSWCV